MRVVALLAGLASLASAQIGPECHLHKNYPPKPSQVLPHATVNLDSRPEDRWTDLVKPLAPQILNVITTFTHNKTAGTGPIGRLLHMDLPLVLAKLGAEISGELRGISKATGIDLLMIVGLNLAYEIEGACTSIIGEDAKGNLLHGRNLDFGLFSGLDKKTGIWELTQALRPILRTVDFMKGGKVFYSGVVFAGYIGCLTCVKKGAFSVSVNTRFDKNLDEGLFKWILEPKDHSVPLSVATRKAIETKDTFEAAVAYMNTTDYVGPSYAILGGSHEGQGAIISTSADGKFADLYRMHDNKAAPWYLVQTNYDHWKAPPVVDDRRYPAERCLNKTTQADYSKETLYNVLTAVPNRNELTTYSSIMSVADGTVEAWMEYCHPETEPLCKFSPW